MNCTSLLFCCLATASIIVSGHEIKPTNLGIIGGRTTNILKHPYQVTIVGGCSGAIIHNRWILTLASCVIPYYVDINKYPIRTGSNSQSKGGKQYYIEKAVVHTNFSMETVMYNFALLKINETIKFDKKTKKIGYATKGVKAGTAGVVTGWSDSKGGNQSVFKEVTLKTIKFITCQKQYESGSVHVYKSMMCAASKDKVQGPCGFDYGDPLVFKKKLLGLFTLYVKCPAKEYPSIFADVTSVAPWIKQTISKN